MYTNHSNVFGCALPPGLPDSVRGKVLRHFDQSLFTYLMDVMRERRMSDCLGQSEALASDDEDDQIFEEFISSQNTLQLRYQSGLER